MVKEQSDCQKIKEYVRNNFAWGGSIDDNTPVGAYGRNLVNFLTNLKTQNGGKRKPYNG